MTEAKAQPRFSIAVDNALEIKVAELTAAAEALAQKIAVAQNQSERLEKEVEDFRRQKQQAETEYQSQEQLVVEKRREIHKMEIEIEKHAGNISGQQERLRTLAETIEIADKRSKQAIEAYQAETENKLKGVRHEYNLERERMSLDLNNHSNHIQTEMKQLTDEWEQTRKKQLRTLEIEGQDAKKKTEDMINRMLQEGRSKNEALIKATEATALEVHRESEAAAKRLLVDADQKAADIIRAAQLEAEEIRRRTHNAEVSFLKEKNSGLAELKLMVNNAKDEAQAIIAAAHKAASELQQKADQETEAKVTALNSRISQARKAAEKEAQELSERNQAELARKAVEQEAVLARKAKENDELIARERKRIEDETRTALTSARDRAHAIVEAANHEKNYKIEELKALESTMFQTARQSASAITNEAERIAVKIVEEARERTRTIEKSIEAILERAHADGMGIREAAQAYYDKIKRELPDPANWDSELARIRQQEQDRLQALIEPTVMNYLKAIDMTISNLFVELPSKYQRDKVIHDFAQAIANIQQKKHQIRFSDLIPRNPNQTNPGVGQQPISHPPFKKTS